MVCAGMNYLTENTVVKELLQFLVAVVDAELLETIQLVVFC